MGLTMESVGTGAIDHQFIYQRKSENEKIIALAGNPNVGKSTIFNNLTGLHQHTGNWPGKTVTTAFGTLEYHNNTYTLVDLPGTYSLLANSAEEQIARDYICFGEADAVVIVCDAVSLERNLNLVLQTIEITNRVIVCVNLMDEARKKKIHIDLKKLSKLLGVPVVGTSAVNKKSLPNLMHTIETLVNQTEETTLLQAESCSDTLPSPLEIKYPPSIEKGIELLTPLLSQIVPSSIQPRWAALKMIDYDPVLFQTFQTYTGYDFSSDEKLEDLRQNALSFLKEEKIPQEKVKDCIVACLLSKATMTAKSVVSYECEDYDRRDRKIDKILTSKRTGFPIMLALLMAVLWITITGANIPSGYLYDGLFWIEKQLFVFADFIHMPVWLQGMLISGMYRVLAWVVSVMLPPMAIFFPLFTLLEDLGYLPRVAFNLDHRMHKCCACGKQSLTMCMGFGCNAAGVVGCRIIDSPRERLIAILTNVFVPCNGRFPTLISLITMFFIGGISGVFSSFLSAALLTGVIVLGVMMTFLISKLLSKTLLKGIPSSFALELPPYRKPQIGKLIVHSLIDRTLFVLGRAISVAAPAGIVIWILANVNVQGVSLLAYCTDFLDPVGRMIGLDGVILMAFILGFPANEIVIPIIIMAYLCKGQILEMNNLSELKELLVNNGWTWVTGLCTILFSLFHWPCSTTCLTIKKETQSMKWTIVSFILPTVVGFIVCFVVANVCRFFFF